MSAIVICKNGETQILDQIVAYFGSVPWKIGLFQNDYTPTENDVIGDYVEADFSGYAQLNYDGFGMSAWSSGKARSSWSSPKSWTNTTGAVGNIIYGIFVVNGGGILMLAQRSPLPIDMTAAGNAMSYLGRFTFANDPAPG